MRTISLQVYAQAIAPALFVHSGICLPYFEKYATQEQLDKYMPGLISGERVCAIGMTEPDAGSDLQGIRTRAVPDGDDYIINGSKVFITNGIVANTYIIVAITDPGTKSLAHGISLFLMEEDMPGFKKGKNLKKIGYKGHVREPGF